MAAVTNTFTASTIAESAKVNTNFQQLADAILPTFVFTVAGNLSADTNVTPVLVVPGNLTIIKAYAVVKTASGGLPILIDINKNGTSIWSVTQGNRLSITAGATTANQTVFDTTQLADGDQLTIDIDQIGSVTAGADLTVELKCEWR